jgi:APA family basic amino acid/polyamine antiporter
MPEVKNKLKLFDLTIIVISLVIGMGIFRTPTEVAEKAGTIEIFYLAWLAGSIISFLGALTFAEIGSRRPMTGGFYKIFSVCYSPVFAFMVNWITVISNAASTAAVAIMGSTYLASVLFPDNTLLYTQVIAITATIGLMGINILGIRVSVTVLNTLMIIKIMLLIVLISAVFFATSEVVTVSTDSTANQVEPSWKSFLMCFIPVFFTFGGYQQTMNFGGDIDNPSKSLPKAIFIAMIVILILYLGVNYSYVNVLGIDGLAASKTLAADTAEVIFGGYSGVIISIIMFFAVMTYVNVSIMSNPRIYYAMAEDKVLPAFFMKTNTRTNVQVNGVIIFCLFILGTLFFVNSFQKILEYVMFFDSISLITAASAIFILRKRKEGEDEEIYRLKGYPFIPLVYILVYAAVNYAVFLSNPSAFGWGAILFISGFPLYFLINAILKRAN